MSDKPFNEMTEEEKKAAKAKAIAEAKAKAQAKLKGEEPPVAEAPASAAAEKPFSEMTDEEKKAAKAKAIAEAKAKAQAKLKGEEAPAPAQAAAEKPFSEMTDEEKKAAKAKAIAEAKAKAAAKMQGEAAPPAVPDKPLGEMTDEEKKAAKAAAIAAAKAKAAAAMKEKDGGAPVTADDEKAKAIAAAKAKAAAAAAAKTKAAAEEAPAAPKEPSPKQPVLDRIVSILTQELGSDVVEESYIKENSKHMPTIVVKREKWLETATLLKNHSELSFDYVSNLLGVDYKTHLESVTYLYSYPNKHSLAVRVKTKDREDTKIASVANLWAGANWHERESYDLLGIVYEGHPDLRRIMLTDDWVGHPLRKDYEQYDEEV